VLDRDTGCLTPLFGYFGLSDEPTCPPLWNGGKPLLVGPVPVPIQGSDALDTKIFLTIFYECRYKLSCIVNVNGPRLAGLDTNR
jgi:hypothetical protein